MENVVQQQLIAATQKIEEQVDAEIERLEKLDDDDLEKLRRLRLDNMKKQATQKQEWLAKGHGEYTELAEEKEFFDVCKKSDKVVCHFYRDSTFRCKIIDKHLPILAKSHLETRFVKLDVDRAPFLCPRLNIRVLPTLALVKNGKTGDYLVGFDDLGGTDEFTTEMLEWRLGRSAVINYAGDLMNPPDAQVNARKSVVRHEKKTIRGGGKDDSDESD